MSETGLAITELKNLSKIILPNVKGISLSLGNIWNRHELIWLALISSGIAKNVQLVPNFTKEKKKNSEMHTVYYTFLLFKSYITFLPNSY